MDNDVAHHSAWRTAEGVFGPSLVLGLVLDYLWPWTFTAVLAPAMLHVIGAPLLLLGSLIILASKKALGNHGQPSGPKQATTELVTTGLYRWSRNPLYGGLGVCFAGLGLALDNPWLVMLLVPTLVVTQYVLIYPEERYLERSFGQVFIDYQRCVRRWL